MWNCSGLLSSSSAEEKFNFLQVATNPCDIYVFIETHHKSLQDVPFLHMFNTYEVLHSEATEEDSYAGIIIFVNKKYSVLQQKQIIKGRLLNFHLGTGPEKQNISVVYGYTGKKATPGCTKSMVDLLAAHHSLFDQNILLGDFNFVHNDLDRVNHSKLGMNNLDKVLTPYWISMIESLDLSDPFCARNPNRRMFSYIHTCHKSKSRIDRIYVNEESCNNIINYHHTETPFQMAHRIVAFTLVQNKERGPGYWKMNCSILPDQSYNTLVQKIVNETLSRNINDPIERWLIFIETIRIQTQVYCSRKQHIEKLTG